MLPARYVRLFQNKDLLEIFQFLINNCRKTGNMRIGSKIVNPCPPFLDKTVYCPRDTVLSVLCFVVLFLVTITGEHFFINFVPKASVMRINKERSICI